MTGNKAAASKKKAQVRLIENILRCYEAVGKEIEAGNDMGSRRRINPKLIMLMGAIEKVIISIKRDAIDKSEWIQKQHSKGILTRQGMGKDKMGIHSKVTGGKEDR